jgi:tRNA (uracil-5-)-methyltransferase
MNCEFFSKCSSCTLFDYSYDEQLKYKEEIINKEFNKIFDSKKEIFPSLKENFRIRAEFKIQRDTQSYQMMGFDKEFSNIDICHIVDKRIFSLMPILHLEIQKSSLLNNRLFRVEFLVSKTETLVTLIYHRKLNEDWEKEAIILSKKLDIHIIGRSKKQKVILSRDYINESLSINDTKYKYFLQENTFIQPNRFINEKIISWLKNNSTNKDDLLELYCGHGNLTIALADNFNKVLATEISKNSIINAKKNIKLNNITNIAFVKMSSEEFTQAINKEREFFRLRDIDLEKYNFSTILVDPPRAGLDEKTIKLASSFEHIMYISCSLDSLKRDLIILSKTHKIIKMAIFDQFPYTKHIEMGVILKVKLNI